MSALEMMEVFREGTGDNSCRMISEEDKRMASVFAYFKVTGDCMRLGLEVIKVICHLLRLPRTKRKEGQPRWTRCGRYSMEKILGRHRRVWVLA